jgi:hypothetical protein
LRTRFRKFAHLLERGGLGAEWARQTASATKSLDFGDAKFYQAIALVWLATYMEAVSLIINVVKKVPKLRLGIRCAVAYPRGHAEVLRWAEVGADFNVAVGITKTEAKRLSPTYAAGLASGAASNIFCTIATRDLVFRAGDHISGVGSQKHCCRRNVIWLQPAHF